MRKSSAAMRKAWWLGLLPALLLAGCGDFITRAVEYQPELIGIATGAPFVTPERFAAADDTWTEYEAPAVTATAVAILQSQRAAIEQHPLAQAAPWPAGWSDRLRVEQLLVTADRARALARFAPVAPGLPRLWLEFEPARARGEYLYLVAGN